MSRRAGRRRTPPPPTPASAPPSPPWWPRWRDLLDPRQPWLAPLLLLAATRLWMWRTVPFAAEDAYITFRYARNAAAGSGWVFNPGERVFGFSSPLWMAWVALGDLLQIHPVGWTRLTTLALEVLALVVMTTALRRHASAASAWCFAFFYAGWSYFAAVAVSGMESSAMAALIVLAAAWAERGSALAGPGLAAVALIRPEGLAAAAVLSLLARWRDRVVALALTAAAIGGLALYYGSPVPQSLTSKALLYGTPGPLAGRHWWDWLSPFVFGAFPQAADPAHVFLMSVVFAPAAVMGARALWQRRRSAPAATAAACLAVWLGYAALGVAYFWWYFAVPLLGFAVLAAAGLPAIVRGRAVYAAVALLVLGLWTLTPQLYLGRAQNEIKGFGGVASFLRANAQPGDKVMLEPIGLVGYEAPVVVVDEVGLVSPEVAARRLQGPGWYTDVVARERPEWIAIRRGVLAGGRAFAGRGAPFRDLTERDALLAAYRVVAEVDTISGVNALIVLRRAD